MSKKSIYLVMLISVKSGMEEAFTHFIQENAPLLRKYNIQPYKTINAKIKGQLVGLNELPDSNFVSIFKVPSMEDFMDYVADEDYKRISKLRVECTDQVIGYFTTELPLPKDLNSTSNTSERLYIVGFANFIEGDDKGIDDFNYQAIDQGLFDKHGMHIELQLQPIKVVSVVGQANVTTPDRIQVFFVDTPDNIKEYVADPLYKELSPIRDKTLLKYDFFGGSLPA